MVRLLILSILLFPSIASAEQWICFDATTKYPTKVIEGDGLKLGICGLNNSNIDPNCILATGSEFTQAKLPYKKVLVGNSPGMRVQALDQAEIDVIEAAKAQAIADAEAARIEAIDDDMSGLNGITLTKVETAIDNISNLADAKAFLKKLVRYLAKNL